MGASSSTTRSLSTSVISIPLPVPASAYQRFPLGARSLQDAYMSDTLLLVDPQWLSGNPAVRIVDLRWSQQGPPARERYDAGHIPGAAFVDLERDLSQPGGPGRHPFPSENAFARVLSRIGVSEETHVV